jgi:hypothetical protein
MLKVSNNRRFIVHGDGVLEGNVQASFVPPDGGPDGETI